MIDQAYLSAPEDGGLGLVQGGNVRLLDGDRPLRRLVHRAQDVQQRGLAGAGRANDGHELALLHRQIDFVQRHHLVVAGAVYLAYVFTL